jgi:hypothetical protein
MQHITRIKTAVILSAIALFTACHKDDNNNTDQLASLGKATVKGKVFAQLVDTVGAAAHQTAPSGTQIQAWIDTRDLVIGAVPGAAYAKRFYTATVDASGNYSITVDVSKNQTATVHIEPQSFEYNVVKKIFPDSVYTEREVFYPMTMPAVSVNNGSNQVQDIFYN